MTETITRDAEDVLDLYSIRRNEDNHLVVDVIDGDTGEVQEQLLHTLEPLKCLLYVAHAVNSRMRARAQLEMLKREEMDKLNAIYRARLALNENKIAELQDFARQKIGQLKDAPTDAKGRPFVDIPDLGKFCFRTGQKRVVEDFPAGAEFAKMTDEQQLAVRSEMGGRFIREKVSYSLNRVEIAKALKAGEHVKFMRLDGGDDEFQFKPE